LVAERNDNDVRLAAAQAASDLAVASAALKAATMTVGDGKHQSESGGERIYDKTK